MNIYDITEEEVHGVAIMVNVLMIHPELRNNACEWLISTIEHSKFKAYMSGMDRASEIISGKKGKTRIWSADHE